MKYSLTVYALFLYNLRDKNGHRPKFIRICCDAIDTAVSKQRNKCHSVFFTALDLRTEKTGTSLLGGDYKED